MFLYVTLYLLHATVYVNFSQAVLFSVTDSLKFGDGVYFGDDLEN
jgi:hypothetical protein